MIKTFESHPFFVPSAQEDVVNNLSSSCGPEPSKNITKSITLSRLIQINLTFGIDHLESPQRQPLEECWALSLRRALSVPTQPLSPSSQPTLRWTAASKQEWCAAWTSRFGWASPAQCRFGNRSANSSGELLFSRSGIPRAAIARLDLSRCTRPAELWDLSLVLWQRSELKLFIHQD